MEKQEKSAIQQFTSIKYSKYQFQNKFENIYVSIILELLHCSANLLLTSNLNCEIGISF